MFMDPNVIARSNLYYYKSNSTDRPIFRRYGLKNAIDCIIKGKDTLYGTQYHNSPWLSIERIRYFA